ncbi:MAG TPA: amidase [Thermomicrobiales bacterium]|nr:amidase [Thermomicrobiales bacterium]
MVELAYEPMYVVAERIARREVSPVELVETALARVATDGERLNPFITLTADLAREMAREAEREIANGGYRGPLHGIPVVLKDLLQTRGVRTTGGSQILGDSVPDEDATVVRLLREAGAIFVGKTGMPEFAVLPSSGNPFYGPVRNPWDVTRDTGGSSSGTAAAIASGMAWCGPGSDTGGSIRIPAAACGIVGLKPTWGRVSLRGVLPLCAMMDHVGPMARTVRDTALLMQVLAGYDADDRYSRDAPVDDYVAQLEDGIAGLRVAWLVDDGHGPVEREIVEAVAGGVETLRAAGVEVTEVTMPFLNALLWEVLPVLEQVEAAADYEEWLRDRPEQFSEEFRSFAEAGLRTSATEIVRARRRMQHGLHEVERTLAGFDLLVSPTLSLFPPEAGVDDIELVRLTCLWDNNGWPAISVPVGLSAGGLPIGFQIVGRPWHEARVLRAARVIEHSHALTFPPANR